MLRNVLLSKLLFLPLIFYVYFYLQRMYQILCKKKLTRSGRLIVLAGAAALTLPASDVWDFPAVVIFHFLAFAVAGDVLWFLFRKVRPGTYRIGWVMIGCGILPALLTVLVIEYGYLNMHHVIRTQYTLHTGKDIRQEGYRVVFLSDLHAGTTLESGELKKVCDQIEEDQPDLIILGGDIVDESTTQKELQSTFEILGQMNSTYGTYYVYGNHDKGRYDKDCGFTAIELEETIADNGIEILEDETVELNEELTVSGRRDRRESKYLKIAHATPEQLIKDSSGDAYHIMADHQPRGMEEVSGAGYDLMLSGHTHGGQVWPVGLITELCDKETVNYGHEKNGGMDVIVSSGIAGWNYPVRTGKHCEYVVVQILGE